MSRGVGGAHPSGERLHLATVTGSPEMESLFSSQVGMKPDNLELIRNEVWNEMMSWAWYGVVVPAFGQAKLRAATSNIWCRIRLIWNQKQKKTQTGAMHALIALQQCQRGARGLHRNIQLHITGVCLTARTTCNWVLCTK
jgi:hypothetical protein